MKHKRLVLILIALLFWGCFELLSRHAEARPASIAATFTGEFRRTVGQPAIYSMTIWLFGNSTMIGERVADDETIPSALQRLLPSLRVVNAGVRGVGIGGEYERLTEVAIQPGDTAIFYDGTMEVFDLTQQAVVDNRARYPCAWLDAQLSEFHLATMDVLCGWSRDLTSWYADLAWLNPRIERLAVNRSRILTHAADYSQARHARFIHILQPSLCSQALASIERAYQPLCVLYTPVWARLQTIEPDLDFTHVLDPARERGEAWYIDEWHVNADANKVIARAIYDYLALVF